MKRIAFIATGMAIVLSIVWAVTGCKTTTSQIDPATGRVIGTTTTTDVTATVAILQAAIAEADHIYQLIEQSKEASAAQKAEAQAARDARTQQYLALISQALAGKPVAPPATK